MVGVFYVPPVLHYPFGYRSKYGEHSASLRGRLHLVAPRTQAHAQLQAIRARTRGQGCRGGGGGGSGLGLLLLIRARARVWVLALG